MPWFTPTLRQTRELVRDNVTSALSGAILIGNNVLRVMSDAMAGLCHLTLRYIDWLATQLLPDTAETEWLDRHADIWLVNADGSTGRKMATLAEGTGNFTGTVAGTIVPLGTQLMGPNKALYEVTADVTLTVGTAAPGPIRALNPGSAGNLPVGTRLSYENDIPGVEGGVIVVLLDGGVDQEGDLDLRIRVLERIREPPMGGSAADYVRWAKAVSGVTRAWSASEMGMGTVSVRVMCDDLRADNDGFPLTSDLDRVTSYIDIMRPVTVKDRWILSPIPEPIDFEIRNLDPDDQSIRDAITESVKDMLKQRARPAYSLDGVTQPAQTIYAAWISEAITQVPEVQSFRLVMDDHVMPNNGCLAVLGTIEYEFDY